MFSGGLNRVGLLMRKDAEPKKMGRGAKQDQSLLSPSQLYYAHLDEFLVDEVDEPLQTEIGDLATGDEHNQRLITYRKARGRLQMMLAGEHLSEAGYENIRALVGNLKGDDDDASSDEEDELLVHELKGVRQRQIRQAVIYGVIFAAILLVARSFFPNAQIEFNPVEVLVYETRVLEDDFSTRVDLESSNTAELKEYFLNYPKLMWEDVFIKPSPEWVISGASVIDYEIVKISLVAYSKKLSGKDVVEEEREVVSADGAETRVEVIQTEIPRRDMFVHYSFSAKKNYLPNVEPSSHNGLDYYAYSTEDYNIIMWKTQSHHHIVVGRLSPVELVEFIP